MIDICMALDQSVSPHTGVRTIQNTGFFWQADPSLLPFFGTQLRRQNFNLAPTQYRQLRRLVLLLLFFFFLLLFKHWPGRTAN